MSGPTLPLESRLCCVPLRSGLGTPSGPHQGHLPRNPDVRCIVLRLSVERTGLLFNGSWTVTENGGRWSETVEGDWVRTETKPVSGPWFREMDLPCNSDNRVGGPSGSLPFSERTPVCPVTSTRLGPRGEKTQNKKVNDTLGTTKVPGPERESTPDGSWGVRINRRTDSLLTRTECFRLGHEIHS